MEQECRRRSLSEFISYVSPWWTPYRHHHLICDKLEAVERGDIKRILFFMPPRHGKSEILSVHFPVWYLARNPDKRIIHASYDTDLSNSFSRRVRNMIAENERFRELFPLVKLSKDSTAVGQWELAPPYRGGMRSAGVGRGITGHGADLGLIDDPVKGAEAAQSETQREALWNWWQQDFYTRLHPGAPVVATLTRWHCDDWAGRILSGESKEEWEVCALPALSDSQEALWPEFYPKERLLEIQKEIGTRAFESLYQQSPTLESGNLFKKDWFNQRWERLPDNVEKVWTCWDTALKETNLANESAGLTMALGKNGLLYVLNLTHGYLDTPALESQIVQVAKRMKERFGNRYQAYIEDKVSGTTIMQYLRRNHPGLAFVPIKVERDKVTRAHGIIPLCESERVLLPQQNLPWVQYLLDQLFQFPFGKLDDCADAFIHALTVHIKSYSPLPESGSAIDWSSPSF